LPHFAQRGETFRGTQRTAGTTGAATVGVGNLHVVVALPPLPPRGPRPLGGFRRRGRGRGRGSGRGGDRRSRSLHLARRHVGQGRHAEAPAVRVLASPTAPPGAGVHTALVRVGVGQKVLFAQSQSFLGETGPLQGVWSRRRAAYGTQSGRWGKKRGVSIGQRGRERQTGWGQGKG